ncbi:MAG: antitoxin [Microcystaceae cyanobacterium]
MKDHYDFSQSVKNPYFKDLQEPVTLQLKEDVLNYFKQLSEETGIPFQNLIILYLQDCVRQQRKLNLEWLTQE